MYKIKEIYYTLQGEGFHTGRPSIFIRFSGCNLWTGLEKDRPNATCYWCDTNFVGTDGINGGTYTSEEIKSVILNLWPDNQESMPYVVCTGGEPLLQMDDNLIHSIHDAGFEIGIETNGTVSAPKNIDWVCVSPKAKANTVLNYGNEIKIVYPQNGVDLKKYERLNFEHFYLQPLYNESYAENLKKTLRFIHKKPLWKLSLQTHKYLGIR